MLVQALLSSDATDLLLLTPNNSIEDISEFVREQYQNLADFSQLIVPRETIYPVTDLESIARLQLSASIEY